jgi:hypothetical protein
MGTPEVVDLARSPPRRPADFYGSDPEAVLTVRTWATSAAYGSELFRRFRSHQQQTNWSNRCNYDEPQNMSQVRSALTPMSLM